jgi:hypothetical protein
MVVVPLGFSHSAFLKISYLTRTLKGVPPVFVNAKLVCFFQHNSTKQWVCGRYGDGSIPIDTFLVG